MSVKVMGEVFEAKLKPGVKWTLAVMADRVEHDGSGMYYAVETLAWKTGYAERQIQRHIGILCAMEPVKGERVLVLVREADRRKPAEYRINLTALRALPRAGTRGDKMSPHPKPAPRGDISADQGRHPDHSGVTNRAEIHDKMSPNPTTDPTTDPTPGAVGTALAEPAAVPPSAPPAAQAPAALRFEGTGPVVVEILLAGKSDPVFRARASMLAEYRPEFPALDIAAELRAIARWNLDHPTKRKTRDGMRRHITNWLKVAQNDPRKRASAQAGTPRMAAAGGTGGATQAAPKPCALKCGRPAGDSSFAGIGVVCDPCRRGLIQNGRQWRPQPPASAAGAGRG